MTADLATALSTCVTRDGQSPPTTNLPMGSFKLTGLAAGTAAGHSVRFEQLQTGVNKLITVAGTGDVITGVMTPTCGAYTNGDMFTFIVGSTNTTNVTINIDGLGAKDITNGTTALTAGELTANRVVVIQYDGTRFQLLNSYLVTLTNVSGTLPVAHGGTGSTSTTYCALATNVSGTLPVANGGSGVTTSTGTGAVVLGTSPTLTTPTISSLSSASATALTLQSAGTTGLTIDTSQNLAFNSGYGSVATAYGCRAWVNFNGTGTVAIRASGNVSSITDNGTGDYTVNFTTAMSDANYCFQANGYTAKTYNEEDTSPIRTTSAINLVAREAGTNAFVDAAQISVAIFR